MSVHQELQIIGLLSPADQQAGGITPDSINMGLLHKVQIIFLTGVVTGDGATIQFYSGATNAAKTTEFYPYYRLAGAGGGAAVSDDVGRGRIGLGAVHGDRRDRLAAVRRSHTRDGGVVIMYTNQHRDVFTTMGLGFRVDKAAATLPASTTQDLFVISGGLVLVTLLIGEVTTAIQGQA